MFSNIVTKLESWWETFYDKVLPVALVIIGAIAIPFSLHGMFYMATAALKLWMTSKLMFAILERI